MASSAGHKTGNWHVSMNDLPHEILIKIFSHMSFAELINVIQEVCTRWKRLSRDAKLWANKEYEITGTGYYDKELYTWDFGVTDQEAIQTFCKAPKLHKIRMHRAVTSRVFRSLYSRCHQLTELHIHYSQKLSYSILKNLVEQCPKIHTLGISMEILKSEKFVEAVLRLQHLRVLKIEGYFSDRFSDSPIDLTEFFTVRRFLDSQRDLKQFFTGSPLLLRHLADGFPQLSEIDFTHISIDMDDLRHFLNAKRSTLKSIHIKWTATGGRCVLPLLAICADSLKCLELYDNDVVDDEESEALTTIGSFKNLQELKMEIFSTQRCPIHLAFKSGGLRKLKLLHLLQVPCMDNDTIITICHTCPALRELKVEVGELQSNAAFSHIHCLKNLEKLYVSIRFGVDWLLIPYLTRLPKLHTLSIQGQDFKMLEPGVSSVLDLSGLRCLILNGSIVTGIPFDKFPSKLLRLRELHIDECSGDIKPIAALTQQMPNLKICGNFQGEVP